VLGVESGAIKKGCVFGFLKFWVRVSIEHTTSIHV
jgi:hypothetical protein